MHPRHASSSTHPPLEVQSPSNCFTHGRSIHPPVARPRKGQGVSSLSVRTYSPCLLAYADTTYRRRKMVRSRGSINCFQLTMSRDAMARSLRVVNVFDLMQKTASIPMAAQPLPRYSSVVLRSSRLASESSKGATQRYCYMTRMRRRRRLLPWLARSRRL